MCKTKCKSCCKALFSPCRNCEDKCCCCIPAWAGIIVLTFLKIGLLLPAMVYGGDFIDVQYIATLVFLITLAFTVYAISAALYSLNNLVLMLVVTIYLHFAFAIGVLDLALSYEARREKEKLQRNLLCFSSIASVVVNFYLLIIVCTYYKLHRKRRYNYQTLDRFASTIRIIV